MITLLRPQRLPAAPEDRPPSPAEHPLSCFAQRHIGARDPDLRHRDKAINKVLNKKRCCPRLSSRRRGELGWRVHRRELWPAPYFCVAKLSINPGLSWRHRGTVTTKIYGSEVAEPCHKYKRCEGELAPVRPQGEACPLARPLPQPNFLSFGFSGSTVHCC